MRLSCMRCWKAGTSQYKQLIVREGPKSKWPLRILRDDQALLVQDGSVKLVGKTPEVVLDQVQEP